MSNMKRVHLPLLVSVNSDFDAIRSLNRLTSTEALRVVWSGHCAPTCVGHRAECPGEDTSEDTGFDPHPVRPEMV